MNKGQFSTSAEYVAALGSRQYVGHEPVDADIAPLCLKDSVDVLGDTQITVGSCPVARECNYANNKISGVSGFCLKQAVGVEIK